MLGPLRPRQPFSVRDRRLQLPSDLPVLCAIRGEIGDVDDAVWAQLCGVANVQGSVESSLSLFGG